MDRRSWPWKKKSSDKTVKSDVVTDSGGRGGGATSISTSTGSQADKDSYKKPNYVQISVESYNRLTNLEDEVKTYEQQVHTLEEQVNELREKLSAAESEMTTKDGLVKQHAKVAEEAVSGWEKAEAEALALKNHLELVTLSKLTAEDRAAHLDGALKECMRQIRNLKEENEQKLQDVIISKTKLCEKIKLEFEAKTANLEQELLRSAAENAALSRSLQERASILIKMNEEKCQADFEIERLKTNIGSCEGEINSLKYELHLISKELEIRNEEKNMSVRAAEVANKQQMEGVKKIAKLEAECQRLRGLVRKRLPGPAALAQMKLEVESLGREYGDSRLRRSPVKPSSPHLSAMPEISHDNAQKLQKDNEFLTERLLAMEEETKMLKEALANRNSELQASRNMCAKTASRLQSLEAQISNEQKNPLISVVQVPTEGYSSENMRNPPSLTSLSEDGNDDDRSCADSWATSLISEISQLKKDKRYEKSNQTKNSQHFDLMDDFLEMEKLACSNANGAILISDSPDNKTSEIANGGNLGDVSLGNNTLLAEDSGSHADHSPLMKLKSKMSMLLDSISKDADTGKILEDVKQILQDAHDALNLSSASSVTEEGHTSDATCPDNSRITGNKEIATSEDIKGATRTVLLLSPELASAISSIHDFVLFLGKEAMAVRDTSYHGSDLSRKIEDLSVTFNEVLNGSTNLVDFVLDLSRVLANASELRFNVLGYKGSDAEISTSDCIDKVALPENKVLQRASSGESYQNGRAHISSPASTSTSNPEFPDDGNLISSYGSNTTMCKVSMKELGELKSEKNQIALDLARCTENLEMSKSQLLETEQLLAEAKSQLASVQKSNSLAETQLKCMAESYRLLEARAEALETEVNLLRAKAETLENELQEEKRFHSDTLTRCKELEEQLQMKESCSVCSSAAVADIKTNQDKELAAAAEKLAECQETIFLLGKQLKALRPQTEVVSSAFSEKSGRGNGFADDELTAGGMNLQDGDHAEINTTISVSVNHNRADSESSMVLHNQPSSPSDTETSLTVSPTSSKHSIHYSNSTTSSYSLMATPEKHPRGISRFFSSKAKNGN